MVHQHPRAPSLIWGKPDRSLPHWHDSISARTALVTGLVSQEEGVKMTGGKFSQRLSGARKNHSRLPRPGLYGRKKMWIERRLRR